MNKSLCLALSFIFTGSAVASSAGDDDTSKKGSVPVAASAMAVAPKAAFKGNWSATFKTPAGDITHDSQRVSFGGMSSGKTMTLNTVYINGVQMKAPLIICVDSTKAEFENALRASGLMK